MDNFNEQIADIWEKLYTSDKKKLFEPFLVPTPYPEVKQYNFLCIGLNPSFDVTWWYDIIKSSKYRNKINDVDEKQIKKKVERFSGDKKQYNKKFQEAINNAKQDLLIEFFKYQSKNKYLLNIEMFRELECISSNTHAYFSKFKDLAKKFYKSEGAFIHLDLFCFKQTSSKKLLDYIKIAPYFFEGQLKIFREILCKINPKVILVANANASRIFKLVFFDNKSEDFLDKISKLYKHHEFMHKEKKSLYEKSTQLYNEEQGYYNYSKHCKVFFSGMLTQQRALDLDSYDRLVLVMGKHIASINKLGE